MPFIGDLERLVAALYPNRLLLGAAGALLLAVLAAIGYRRGWHRTARRHPRATAVVIAAALAVGMPAAWVLGSPLFIRTQLVEPAPVSVAAGPAAATPEASPAAPSFAASSPAAAAPPSPPTPPPSPPLALRGRFKGADDFHTGSGTARVVETAPGTFVLRLEDLAVRNGPDLYVYISPEARGYVKGSLELGRLKATDGSFNYAIPAGADPARFRSVVIWCKAFSVQFAHATLAAA